MYAILADQRWHPLETVLLAMARTVHVGRAVRYIEYERRRITPRPRKRPMTLENQVLAGQRHFALDSLRQHIRDGRVELRSVNGRQYVRLPPPTRQRKGKP
jgi:hypothetical protein